ncbi:hypothetical protein LJR164_002225 [Phenylobacterium sp. LjRoot164]|uniref:hypothetical protein n=1 Tax=unclassified Phenylobacterium TaxID=2640670 RepID=UPI003ECDDEDE
MAAEVTRETVDLTTRAGYGSATGTATTNVIRTGVAYATFTGSTGRFTYPDGRQRELSNVVATAHEITASYDRKAMFTTTTWKIQVNRLTGAIRIVSPSEVGFAGTCTPVSNTPKF